MRILLMTLLLYPALMLAGLPQQSPSPNQNSGSDSRALQLLQQSIAATSLNVAIADALVTGTATYHSGNQAIQAGARIEFKGVGQSRLDLNEGNLRSEIRNGTFTSAEGQSRDEHGKVRRDALHNCQLPPSLLFPALLLQSLLENGGKLEYVAGENVDAIAVDHLRYSHGYLSRSQTFAAEMQKLSTLEIYLDSRSHQLVKVTYNLHPDDNAWRNLRAEVRYSDYREINGVLIPYHIVRRLQGAENLDLAIENAVLNSGVQDSEFALQ